jgi:hypothetical protein
LGELTDSSTRETCLKAIEINGPLFLLFRAAHHVGIIVVTATTTAGATGGTTSSEETGKSATHATAIVTIVIS